MNNLSRAFRTLAVIAVVSVVGTPGVAPAQTEPSRQVTAATQQQKQMKMKQMKMPSTKMEEMTAQRKANTDRITALMAQVQNAAGDARVAALAEVIGILVEERAAMQQHCAEMQAMMAK